MQEAYIYTAISALLIAGIVVFLYWPWQRICEDMARQKLFEIRDDLFMMAAKGEFSFEDEAYQTMRRYLELTIRYAHQLSWMSLVGYAFLMPRELLHNPRDPLSDAVDNVEDAELRATLSDYKERAEGAMMTLMVLRSPLLIVATLVAAFVLGIVSVIKSNAVRKVYELIASEVVPLALYDVNQSDKAGVPIRA